MTTFSIDFSYARPNPAAIKAAGYVGVWRYLSGGTAGKDITFDEFESYLKAGLGVGLVWETTGERALDGAAAGAADGRAALAQVATVGYPHGAPLVCNVGDFAATAAQIPAIEAYYNAFVAQVAAYQFGGYATGYIIDQLVALGCKGIWWQNAENDEGVPGNELSPYATVYQDVVETLPEIAGSPRSDYDQDAIIGNINWAMTDPPPIPPEDPVTPEDIANITAANIAAMRQAFSPGNPATHTPEGELYGRLRTAATWAVNAEIGAIVKAVVAAMPAPKAGPPGPPGPGGEDDQARAMLATIEAAAAQLAKDLQPPTS